LLITHTVDPEGSAADLTKWRSAITLYFTWLFIGTRCVFFFFLLFVAYKFGHIKLAPTPDEEPELSTGSYFMMIFAAGVAVALFVYGVAEPLWHQNSHYFAQQSYRTQDEVDQFAINMTVTNWGFTAWAPYLIVAVAMGLAGHRFGLPMTFRTCFYPILGEYTWGWMGDAVDGFTIVTTVAGVCTSLGLGAINIVAGFQFLGWVDEDISQDRLTLIQNLTIWGITTMATISVLSGLHHGVQLLSKVAFAIGMLLFFLIFIMVRYSCHPEMPEIDPFAPLTTPFCSL
jgi:choline-glycine betaine transporter